MTISFDPLFPPCDSDPELEYVEYQQAYEEWWKALQEHPGKICEVSLTGGHCLRCQYLTGDPHYVWRRLMIINRQPTEDTG